MKNTNSSHISIGIALLVVGIVMLSFQLVPDLRQWIAPFVSWPVFIAAFGLFLILTGYISRNAESINGGCFFIGLGAIFTWQVQTQDWASWAYMWTLFPAFSGVGLILSSFLRDNPQAALLKGLQEIMVSAVMFFLFSTLLGGKNWIGPFWPVLIILAGLLMLAKPIFNRSSIHD
jgi:uncharacterized membrane protein YvlD (DUF360 family)